MKSMAASIGLLIVAMLSIQFGATVAKHLFGTFDPAAISMMRTGFAAIFMLLVMKPWREPMPDGAWLKVLLYGATLGLMNLLFYMSLQRIPLGLAVALEFTGPLGVALLGSRRLLDLLWVALAAIGIYLLLPIGGFSLEIDLTGVLLALVAGICWGFYIIFGKSVSAVASTRQATTWGMVFAALLVLPFGLFKMKASAMLAGEFWGRGIIIALLSSVIPYSLEMIVLKRMDSKTFGTLMSIEPALAAGMGLIFLQEILSPLQLLAMSAIVCACLGSTLSAPVLKPAPLPL